MIISHEGSDAEIDEIVQKLFTISSAPNFTHHGKVELIPDVSDEEYMQKVIRAKEYIRQGDIFQVVLSRTFIAELDISPFALYRALRKLNQHLTYICLKKKSLRLPVLLLNYW